MYSALGLSAGVRHGTSRFVLFVEISSLFPCNSEDEPVAQEKLAGIECTYQLAMFDPYFTVQSSRKTATARSISPTPQVKTKPAKTN
ncbi:MAG: hypothetical protein ABJA02_02575 [Acidobacteriota bacterium]